jgi:hypothetical protein
MDIPVTFPTAEDTTSERKVYGSMECGDSKERSMKKRAMILLWMRPILYRNAEECRNASSQLHLIKECSKPSTS